MTHKSNPKFLPPIKSADEYEREIISLKLQLQEAETILREASKSPWDSWADPSHLIAARYFARKNDLDLLVEDLKKDTKKDS
jgi:hypothetical protein